MTGPFSKPSPLPGTAPLTWDDPLDVMMYDKFLTSNRMHLAEIIDLTLLASKKQTYWARLNGPALVERRHSDRTGTDPWIFHEFDRAHRVYDPFGIGDPCIIEYFDLDER
jgi:hypothetical protein